jgi:exosome complex exonuclease RRP6
VTHGKKKKRASGQEGGSAGSGAVLGAGSVRALTKDKGAAPGTKPKVPFHDPSIPRPQDVYKIIVDNYKPFEHVWLERSEDGSRPVHPLEKLPVEQFVDRNVAESEPVKPADLEDTPFTLVEDHKGLMELAKKLKSVTEFAVDLEHNQYRSFQGLTCLMQISTRTEDFIVDTLKLRIYIGLYLQEPFKDPTKRKVMHGADRDIMWLQRDFHIYVCNLFDTGQASRVLQMERNSLEHLLLHFCGVTAKKEYQNADWRSRPLPEEMIKYCAYKLYHGFLFCCVWC